MDFDLKKIINAFHAKRENKNGAFSRALKRLSESARCGRIQVLRGFEGLVCIIISQRIPVRTLLLKQRVTLTHITTI